MKRVCRLNQSAHPIIIPQDAQKEYDRAAVSSQPQTNLPVVPALLPARGSGTAWLHTVSQSNSATYGSQAMHLCCRRLETQCATAVARVEAGTCDSLGAKRRHRRCWLRCPHTRQWPSALPLCLRCGCPQWRRNRARCMLWLRHRGGRVPTRTPLSTTSRKCAPFRVSQPPPPFVSTRCSFSSLLLLSLSTWTFCCPSYSSTAKKQTGKRRAPHYDYPAIAHRHKQQLTATTTMHQPHLICNRRRRRRAARNTNSFQYSVSGGVFGQLLQRTNGKSIKEH